MPCSGPHRQARELPSAAPQDQRNGIRSGTSLRIRPGPDGQRVVQPRVTTERSTALNARDRFAKGGERSLGLLREADRRSQWSTSSWAAHKQQPSDTSPAQPL